MKIHFIAIGGSVMHNLAIALKLKGYQVSGSDDEIYEPSHTRLRTHGLLPAQEGWFPEKITADLEAVVLGMHARADNPELARARELGLRVYSYPEYIYEQSRNKERVVVAGSHGKTTITAMIMHVLAYHQQPFDYMIGALVPGFDTTVRLSESAPVIVIEGDEYLASPTDPTPKFLHYRHHIGLVSGIAWDHVNVFPVFDDYVRQFERFASQTPKAGCLIYCEEDDLATIVATSNQMREDILVQSYKTHKNKVLDNGTTQLITDDGRVEVPFFGRHNMQNLNGARLVCHRLGISDERFYQAIATFKGASRRLETVGKNAQTIIFRDFAHAPSKLKATTQAVKEQFANRQLVACAELHTYSSLNKNFIGQYKGALDQADRAIVYYNPKAVALKRLEPIDPEEIVKAFGRPGLKVFTDSAALKAHLTEQNWANKNLLLMSSGTFDNLDLAQLAGQLLG
ncbi:MAG: Mur ligase domain-containing protein [Bernardetiaceae bacterium]|jgi:UDP-N-acetylmuramate: L-alanyl-gamma-D-glutamyl-meso-diaminopimelate ligase|nr:Mur ligase domain-containing protein [Bernardetiaceae bacterium]